MGRPAPGERRLGAGTSPDACRGLGAEPAPRRGDGTAHRCRRLYCFAGEQGQGRIGGIIRTPHLPTCLMWLRRVLPTNWEISEMLGDNPVAFPLWALVEYF